MTGHPPAADGAPPSGGSPSGEDLWGFCERCERWRYSREWFRAGGEEAACPQCGTAPSPLETVRDGRRTVVIVLELPPGGELPLLF